MEGFLVVLGFLVLFMLGFPVVLAIAMPCLVYIFAKDLPLDLVAQRTLYALDSFPLVAVPVFLLVGILPGILCVVMLMAMTGWLALRRNYPRTARWPTRAEVWRDFKPALPAILAPVILIAGMLMGFFTPTEIASVTVLYALLISSLFYRELTWKGILDASYETIRSSSGILLIVAVAALFGWILSVEGVPQQLTALMLRISTNPYALLLIVNLLLLVVGMFLDSTTAILVIAPIIAKPLVAAGVDPVHLGMVVVFNLMIGLLTPPMGLALFLVAEIAKVTMKDVLKEMLPYYVPLAITLLLITYFPAITTWIPRLALAP